MEKKANLFTFIRIGIAWKPFSNELRSGRKRLVNEADCCAIVGEIDGGEGKRRSPFEDDDGLWHLREGIECSGESCGRNCCCKIIGDKAANC
jgi:hypothetical protein